MNLGEMLSGMARARETMERVQSELAQKTVEGLAGGGMIKVTANGRQEIVSVKIDPALLAMNDAGMAEDLVKVATNQALEKARELAAGEMRSLLGGLGPLGPLRSMLGGG
jgi:DNA-binding YbaB/EbfC family protein